MNIKILNLIDGAKKATGLTVIIDVFRAFSMEAYMMSLGAEKIIPVGNIECAYRLKEENPHIILAGERRGEILPGFDTGNSPWQLSKVDVKGRTVVHTTSAGTQGIVHAVGADEILGGSLVTANATAEYIKRSGAKDVSLVCMGLGGELETDEDTLCAEYIKSILIGTKIDIEKEIENLKLTSGAKFFDKTKKDVFPERDFYMCTEVDKFNFVLRLKKSPDGMNYMEKYCL